MDRPLSTAVAQIVSGDSLPTEFLIFAAGDNETLDGVFHFTPKSAKSVIDERLRWGIRLMVDLEHKSVLPPDSIARCTDSMCWADVEIRDGACYGVNAEWTPEGAERLKNKSQIYLSPTFYYNEETLEIEALYNVALVSAPKTLNAPALASAEFKGAKKMDIAQFVALAKSMGAATVEETIDGMRNVVNAFGAPGEKKPEPKVEEPEEPAAPPAPAQSAAVVPPPAAPVEEKVPATNSALFNENANLKTQVATLGAQLEKVESGERRACVAELVKLGVEIPATAWEDDAGSIPVARLRSEPIADLKTRIAKLSAVPGRAVRNAPPAVQVANLSARELQICSETGCTPERYAALKSARGEK